MLTPEARSAAVTALPAAGTWRPGTGRADPAVLVQRFDRDGEPLADAHPIGTAVVRTVLRNAHAPARPGNVRTGERILVAWTEGAIDGKESTPAPCVLGPELDLLGEPVASPEVLHAPLEQIPVVIARGSIAAPFFPRSRPRRRAASWPAGMSTRTRDFDLCDLGSAVMARSFDDFEAATPPPPGDWLRPAVLPGFEIQVRIGDAAGDAADERGSKAP